MTDLLLSIDFEDFAHDTRRDLGLWDTGPLRIDALWRAYADIDAFLARHGGPNGRHATFFCTGVIADQAPDLIGKIAADGHEVACHYHFHDCLDTQSPATVDTMFGRAKDTLEAAAGAPVRGFRAPKFRIARTRAQYEVVERHFEYDSTFTTDNPNEIAAFKTSAGLSRLKILPIFHGRPYGRGPRLRLGGSFLKLFPLAVGRRLIAQARARDFTPHIYLHPYEFTATGDFRLSGKDLRPLGTGKSLYWQLRQNQWHKVGNRGLPEKLRRLIPESGLGGRLDRHLAEP